ETEIIRNTVRPTQIQLHDPILTDEICSWPFADQFVSRILREDIPQRVQFGNARIWAYQDTDNQIVGFGTIDVNKEYHYLTQGQRHPHIPLLAVKPGMQGRGYGGYIIDHLIGEAAFLTRLGCADLLF